MLFHPKNWYWSLNPKKSFMARDKWENSKSKSFIAQPQLSLTGLCSTQYCLLLELSNSVKIFIVKSAISIFFCPCSQHHQFHIWITTGKIKSSDYETNLCFTVQQSRHNYATSLKKFEKKWFLDKDVFSPKHSPHGK